jgi:hypothetical protein
MTDPTRKENPINVLGGELSPCSLEPLTGFFRDGCCNTCKQDEGSHTLCVEISEHFLEFSRAVGNDLSTPQPAMSFQGLKQGDRWCLCAARWLQAYQEGAAPRIILSSSHISALQIVPIELLKEYAITVN